MLFLALTPYLFSVGIWPCWQTTRLANTLMQRMKHQAISPLTFLPWFTSISSFQCKGMGGFFLPWLGSRDVKKIKHALFGSEDFSYIHGNSLGSTSSTRIHMPQLTCLLHHYPQPALKWAFEQHTDFPKGSSSSPKGHFSPLHALVWRRCYHVILLTVCDYANYTRSEKSY